jgi:hypothetical protein
VKGAGRFGSVRALTVCTAGDALGDWLNFRHREASMLEEESSGRCVAGVCAAWDVQRRWELAEVHDECSFGVGQTTPRSVVAQTAGVEYEGNAGPGLNGWTISNAVPASSYLGNGGTHTEPGAAYVEQGIWQRTMDMQAGDQSVFSVHCNSHGCGRWNSGYNLFELDSNAGVDTISFQPTTSTLQMSLRGSSYQFSPQGLTAGTINAGTVNATTLNGAVGAAQLPLFGASGAAHARGAVPDPGTTAGTTRYLREDGTWSVPSGTSGSGGQSIGTGLSGRAAPIAGAAADYNFLEGTGTVVTDITGNGNNATLSAGALPVWLSNGLSFTADTQSVILPTSINTAKTWLFSVYINGVSQNSGYASNFGVFLTSSLGPSGLNLLYYGNGPLYMSPQSFSGSSNLTNCTTPISGFHVIGFALGVSGTSTDHFISMEPNVRTTQRKAHRSDFRRAAICYLVAGE